MKIIFEFVIWAPNLAMKPQTRTYAQSSLLVEDGLPHEALLLQRLHTEGGTAT